MPISVRVPGNSIVGASGFDMAQGAGGQALLNVLKAIRDNAESPGKVVGVKPQ